MADNWWVSSSKTRPCLDSVSVSNSNINIFQDSDTATSSTKAAVVATVVGSGAATSLPMMGLGLSSQSLPQSLDWNQALLGDEKGDIGFQNLLQDQDHNLSSNTSHFHVGNIQWKPQKIYSTSSQDSSSEFKQINVRGFQLDQPMQDSDNESINTCQGLNSSFQNMELYGSPSSMMQSLFGSDDNQQPQPQEPVFDQNHGLGYSLYQSNYDGVSVPISGGGGGVGGSVSGGELSTTSWPNFSLQSQEFKVNSASKVQLADMDSSQLHFANNAHFWNASPNSVNDIQSGFFPSLHMQLPSSSFEDKPKLTSKIPKESTIESSSSSSSTKRPRIESQSPLPAFKVKKEKMGDRITALQQLVSPFGKTDTASVLSEAILYIKFLHEQVNVLSTPYMKSGAQILQQQQQQQQQTQDKPLEEPRKDLRNRGLCLVPVSSTFPVTHETTVDFWTPTFGGTFR